MQLSERFQMIARGEDPFEPLVELKMRVFFDKQQTTYASLELKDNKVVSYRPLS